ncbi:HET-domain-containing protein [Macroventuria anomochaeta]|uniref:HET-domain-containing protein n=1 Tax=Macroventuria anomochaeta TaxID=301207 RepID=A0ACB6SHE4_9PLEO|nr:HET-domain-containing protein [Macroventuria anomochaeta]KAF2632694.1 HET-domain-containing protein [Macroventuria anomochaeta]
MRASSHRAHVQCKPYDEHSTRLPTRVGTRDSDSVRLHISHEGEIRRYVTLSYCWGNERPLTTTKDNFQHHTEAVPLLLPKNFSDAKRVARALGVWYLWIDSICIIQDCDMAWNE